MLKSCLINNATDKKLVQAMILNLNGRVVQWSIYDSNKVLANQL